MANVIKKILVRRQSENSSSSTQRKSKSKYKRKLGAAAAAAINSKSHLSTPALLNADSLSRLTSVSSIGSAMSARECENIVGRPHPSHRVIHRLVRYWSRHRGIAIPRDLIRLIFYYATKSPLPQPTYMPQCIYSAHDRSIYILGGDDVCECWRFSIQSNMYYWMCKYPDNLVPQSHTVCACGDDDEMVDTVLTCGVTQSGYPQSDFLLMWDKHSYLWSFNANNDDSITVPQFGFGVKSMRVRNQIHFTGYFGHRIWNINECKWDRSRLDMRQSFVKGITYHGFVYAKKCERLIAFGGWNQSSALSKQSIDAMYTVNLKSNDNRWMRIDNGRMPTPLCTFGYILVFDRWIIVFGGKSQQSECGEKTYSADIYVCDIDQLFTHSHHHSHTQSHSLSPTPPLTSLSHSHSHSYNDDDITDSEDTSSFSSISAVNQTVQCWSKATVKLPFAMNGMSVVMTDDFQIHLFGGYDGVNDLSLHLVYDVTELCPCNHIVRKSRPSKY